LHWDEAARELAGRPDSKMITFLEGFPDFESAVRVIKSNDAPGPKLVQLQALLDPGGPVYFEDTLLDETSIGQRIIAGGKGDETALRWLESVLNEHILKAHSEVTESTQGAQADYLLKQWKSEADETAKRVPADYQQLAREAFRTALPMLFAEALNLQGDK
jgi:hypothetical protein